MLSEAHAYFTMDFEIRKTWNKLFFLSFPVVSPRAEQVGLNQALFFTGLASPSQAGSREGDSLFFKLNSEEHCEIVTFHLWSPPLQEM